METWLAAITTARWPFIATSVTAAQTHAFPFSGSVRAGQMASGLQRLVLLECARAPAWKLIAPRAFRHRLSSLQTSHAGNAILNDLLYYESETVSPYHQFSVRANGQPTSTLIQLSNVTTVDSGNRTIAFEADEYVRPILSYTHTPSPHSEGMGSSLGRHRGGAESMFGSAGMGGGSVSGSDGTAHDSMGDMGGAGAERDTSFHAQFDEDLDLFGSIGGIGEDGGRGRRGDRRMDADDVIQQVAARSMGMGVEDVGRGGVQRGFGGKPGRGDSAV